MEKKIIVKGWVGRRDFNSKKIWDIMKPESLCVYRLKGKKEEWNSKDWPPVRVAVTIEEIDTENTLVRIDENEN